MQVSAWVPLREEAAAAWVATRWFELSVSSLPDGYWEQALGTTLSVPPWRSANNSDELGPPLAPFAHLRSYGVRGDSKRMITHRSRPPRWDRVGQQVAGQALTIQELDSRGAQGCGGRGVQSWAEVCVVPQWLYLHAGTFWGPAEERDPRWVGWHEQWAQRVLRRFVAEVECDFAMATPDHQMVYLDSRVQAWLPVAQEVLPTYEWVTVAPAGVMAQLGGPTRIRDCEAFWRVEEVAGGSAWLQATEDVDDFRGTVVDAVFDVLAPCLPSRPVPRPELDERLRPFAAYGRRGTGHDPLPGWLENNRAH